MPGNNLHSPGSGSASGFDSCDNGEDRRRKASDQGLDFVALSDKEQDDTQ